MHSVYTDVNVYMHVISYYEGESSHLGRQAIISEISSNLSMKIFKYNNKHNIQQNIR